MHLECCPFELVRSYECEFSKTSRRHPNDCNWPFSLSSLEGVVLWLHFSCLRSFGALSRLSSLLSSYVSPTERECPPRISLPQLPRVTKKRQIAKYRSIYKQGLWFGFSHSVNFVETEKTSKSYEDTLRNFIEAERKKWSSWIIYCWQQPLLRTENVRENFEYHGCLDRRQGPRFFRRNLWSEIVRFDLGNHD